MGEFILMSSLALLDDISFFGPTPPQEVKRGIAVLSKTTPETFQKTLVLVVNYLHGSELTSELFTKQYEETELDRSTAIVLFTGIYSLFRLAIRKRVKPQRFKHDLGELRFPPAMIDEITTTFTSCQEELEQAATNSVIRFPTVEDIKWRVDINISSSSTALSLRPSVLMRMKLTNDTTQQFEMNIFRFHQLRYYVAKTLKDMQDIEQLAILKID